jgi:DNA-binding response OmpR family regulator
MVQRILIADDDPALFEALATALELHGYRTQCVKNGDEALKSILRNRPALLLLDLHMPGLDGEGLLAELGRREIALPTILMSADDEGEAVARAFSVAGFLKKPIAVTLLLSAVAACGTAPPESQWGHDAA